MKDVEKCFHWVPWQVSKVTRKLSFLYFSSFKKDFFRILMASDFSLFFPPSLFSSPPFGLLFPLHFPFSILLYSIFPFFPCLFPFPFFPLFIPFSFLLFSSFLCHFISNLFWQINPYHIIWRFPCWKPKTSHPLLRNGAMCFVGRACPMCHAIA